MSHRQRRKSYNRIHRRTNIVGHIGKEHTFCLIGPIRLHECIFQQILLFQFASDFFIHTAESKYDTMTAVPCSRPYCFDLEIHDFSISDNPVVHIVLFSHFQLFFQFIQRE